MKFNDAFDILKTIEKAVNDPNFIADSFKKAVSDPNFIGDSLKKSQLFNFPNSLDLSNDTSNNIYAESENANTQAIQTISAGNNKFSENTNNYNYYNDYENLDHYDKSKAAYSKDQGLLDSITQELTSARLQQAIILSEIVGKPKSKTRKRRRF